ncbi:MAG TPA: CHASE domain-containing protein [Longimicrobiaceae bacterium]
MTGRQRLPPLLVLLASLLLSAAAAAAVASMSRARDDARFEHAVDGAKDRIISRLTTYETLLRAGAAFVSASEEVRGDEFETFVNRFRLNELYPGIQGIGYSVRVRPEIRDSLIAIQQARLFPDFRIWPDTQGVEEHAIVYLYPRDARNEAAIGYNMFAEATRRAAMEEARDHGRTATSGRVTLVQEISGRAQSGFLMYTPVYIGGDVPVSPEDRRANLAGFVYAPFRSDDLFEGIFGSEERPHVAFRIYDGANPRPERLLHDSEVQGIAPSPSPRFESRDSLSIAGRTWSVAFATTPAFESQTRQWGWIVMLALGVLASLVVYLVTRRQVAARAQAEALALRLQEATGRLEAQVSEVRQLNREVEGANRELERANTALRDSNERLVALRIEADNARDEARHANQAKSEFLASMSHELRTPLNAIMGYAELLDLGIHGPVTPDQRKALDRIRRSQVHLLGLINDILNYAKLEAGRVDVEQAAVPLAGVFADLQAMTEPQVLTRGLTAQFESCAEDVAAWGDADKIQQILLNLLTNAIKFTEPGGEIRVSCRAEANEVVVRVADTGVGIAPDRLEAIFDPFIQVDRTVGRDGQHGVGLGLAISRDLAKLMHGDLSVDSEPGRGSVFTLRLPVAPGLAAKGPREGAATDRND